MVILVKIEDPSTVSVFVWNWRNFFRWGYGFRPHLSDENGCRKRNFLKTLSRVEFFRNAVFVIPCRRGKKELFENDVVSVLDPA